MRKRNLGEDENRNAGIAAAPGAKSGPDFTYTCTVQETDPVGPATIEVFGFDLAGNLGATLDPQALTITPDTPALPLGGTATTAVLLLLVGASTLRRR